MDGERSAGWGELAEILGLPYTVKIGEREVSIQPVTLRELETFNRHQEAIRAARQTDDEATRAAGRLAEEAVVELVTRHSFADLVALPDEERAALLDAAAMANAVLYEGRGSEGHAQDGGEQGGSGDWSAAISTLLENGHKLTDIGDYTLGQVKAFCRAHARLAAERQIGALVASRAGQIEGKDFRKIVAELQRSVARMARR